MSDDLEARLKFAQYVAENFAQLLVIIMLHHKHTTEEIVQLMIQAFPPGDTPDAHGVLVCEVGHLEEVIEMTRKNLEATKAQFGIDGFKDTIH